jgi:hypothetical protein
LVAAALERLREDAGRSNRRKGRSHQITRPSDHEIEPADRVTETDR